MEINKTMLKGLKGAPCTILIHMLLNDGYITKAELCRDTGYSRATLERHINALLHGFVNEIRYDTYVLNNEGRKLLRQPEIEGLDIVPPSEPPGFVYFIVNGEYVKIGHAKDPTTRLSEMNSASPIKLEINGAYEGAVEDEKKLHEQFEEQRHRGEWFKINKEIQELIDLSAEEWKKNFFPTASGINIHDIVKQNLKAVEEQNFCQEIYDLLKTCGIGEPMLSRLSCAGYGVDYVEAHVAYWRKERKSPAILIHRLKVNDPAPESVNSEYDPERYTKGKFSDFIKQ